LSHETQTPQGYDIVRLGPGNVAWMRQLMSVFGEAFEDLPTFEDAPPRDAYLAELLARPGFFTVVATHGDHVVAGLTAYELVKYERERSEIYIYDLAVLEAHRRKGLATALIRAVQAIAAERGAYVIFVQADYADPPAIALYESLGTREEVLHFDIAPLNLSRCLP
jgi:aminoglycoside 3-N-acetyltransferase I